MFSAVDPVGSDYGSGSQKGDNYYAILYYTIRCYTILYYTMLHYTILYYTIPYYTILYYTNTILILHYTILYYTILCYAMLYYTFCSGSSVCGAPTTSEAWKAEVIASSSCCRSSRLILEIIFRVLRNIRNKLPNARCFDLPEGF